MMGVGRFEGKGVLKSQPLADERGIEVMRETLGDRFDDMVAHPQFFSRQVVTDNRHLSESAFKEAALKDDGIIGFSILLHNDSASPEERFLTDKFIVEQHMRKPCEPPTFSRN